MIRESQRQSNRYSYPNPVDKKGLRHAMTALTVVGVGILAANAFKDDTPDFKPNPVPHIMHSGENIWDLANEVCTHTPTRYVVDFIVHASGISHEDIGSLQPGQELVVPESGSC